MTDRPLLVETTARQIAPHLLDHLPDTHGVAWLQRDDGIVGWGEALRIEAGAGEDRFATALDAFAAAAATAEVVDEVGAPGTGLVALGTFTFDARSHGSVLVVPRVVVGRRGGRTWVTRIGHDPSDLDAPLPDPVEAPDRQPDRPRYAGASIPDHRWLEVVATALDRIRAGSMEKVVLARDHAVWAKEPFDPRVLARRLNDRFPGCLTFVVDGMVGATPELLVRRHGRDVESLALAGSARRGSDEAEDAGIGAALLASEKDRWEHALAADSVRDVLAPRCTTLEHADEPSLLRLDNVQHLATRFRGRLAEGETALALAAALHPTAAVGGVPTDRAVEAIRELEAMDRGRYAGPVGWVDASGDGEWGIALRCAELSGARARLFAGAGIVAGSLPEAELEETRLKLRAMQSALDEAPAGA